MAKAIWRGSISFGLVNVPVSLFAGERPSELKFHLLDSRDMSPVHYVRVNQRTGEEVPYAEIVKGYEYEKGAYVVVTDEDFRGANVEATETIDILDFVRADEIDPRFFHTPYYLEPRAEGAKAYGLLRETLRRTGYVGIATVVIRTRQHLAALMVREDMLLLDLMRFPHELRSTAELSLPGRDLSELGVGEKEAEMADRLVDAMVTHWDPSQYHDTYRDDLLALITRKAEVGEVQAPEAAPEAAAGAEVVDIMSLLKRSVEQVEHTSGTRAAGRRKARKG